MSSEWVCELCAVRNDAADSFCCCCQSDRSGTSGNKRVSAFPNGICVNPPISKKQKLVDRREDPEIIRMKYNVSDLKSTCVFIVGSSEIEQIPKGCCDGKRKEGSDHFTDSDSTHECSIPTPILNISRSRVISVSCGALHTALLTSGGVVYTFGCNDMGALGRSPADVKKFNLADSEPFAVRIKHFIRKVTCGDNHTLFLTHTGVVLFTGAFRDNSGDIGIPDFVNIDNLTNLRKSDTPIVIPCNARGSDTIIDIASGENHCVLLPRGGMGIYTFGSNEFGQLIISNNGRIQTFSENIPDLSDENTRKLALSWPQYLTLNDLGIEDVITKRRRAGDEFIAKIFTGYCTSFVQTAISKKIYGAGRNAQGEVGCNEDAIFIDSLREIKEFNGMEIKQLSGGQFFTMALTKQGTVYTWGNADYTGHVSTSGEKRHLSPLILDFGKEIVIEKIFNGADSSFAATKSGKLFAWGSAQNYILGNGRDYTFQRTPEIVPEDHFSGLRVIDGMGGSQHTVFVCQKRKEQ